MAFNSSTIGYFLNFSFWKDALNLLNFQIQQKKNNKHYNTMSMFYYEKLGKQIEVLNSETYFKDKVANNLFYGLENEFAVLSYVVPKPGIRLRNYKFFAYPMRSMYYAVGLYLLKLSQDFLVEYVFKIKEIKSYYGGNLRYSRNPSGIDVLNITTSTTFYLQYYKSFKDDVRKGINENSENKLVLQFDIENYFNEISISILLSFLEKDVKPSIKQDLKYNESTKEQIKFFFNFLSSNKLGIPQMDNDIVSGFIGYLYLIFGDLLLHDEMRKHSAIERYQILRYVDDTYVIITLRDNIQTIERESFAATLMYRVADILYYKLGLKLNNKTKLYWLNRGEDKKILLKSLAKVSPDYHINTETTDKREPEDKIKTIIHELKKLHFSHPDMFFRQDENQELMREVFKDVFDKRVSQLLSKKEYKSEINAIFKDFDFDLIKISVRELLVILLKDEETANNFEAFITNKLRKSNLSTSDIDLVLQFFFQTANESFFNELTSNEHIGTIINKYLEASLSTDVPGYYHLSDVNIRDLSDKQHIIDQIRLRVMNEKTGNYSVALNHLLNEIHAICYVKDSRGKKQKAYEANDVIEFLQSKDVPNDLCINIRNLFDRRNTNQVSHPGSMNNLSWGVNVSEYHSYLAKVGQCLAHIF